MHIMWPLATRIKQIRVKADKVTRNATYCIQGSWALWGNSEAGCLGTFPAETSRAAVPRRGRTPGQNTGSPSPHQLCCGIPTASCPSVSTARWPWADLCLGSLALYDTGLRLYTIPDKHGFAPFIGGATYVQLATSIWRCTGDIVITQLESSEF